MEKLTGACGYILKRANSLYKGGDYNGALMFYNKGINLQPHAREFIEGVEKVEAALDRRKGKVKKLEAKSQKENQENSRINQTKDINEVPKKHDVAPLLKKKMQNYSHLNSKQVFLLEKGVALYKNKEYDLALNYFQQGKQLNPASEEFQFYTHMAERKLEKEDQKKRDLKANMPPPLKVEMPELTDSRSSTVREMQDDFTYRHKYLLERAEKCYNIGDFQGSFIFCEKGLHLQPKSRVFQKSKQKAHDGILISLGLKSPTGEMAQKFLVVELVKAEQYMNDKDYDKAIDQCKETIKAVKEMHLQKIPDKESLISTAFSILGNCYIYIDDNEKALFYHAEDLEVGKMTNNEEIKTRALTNVGRVYVRMKEYKKALDVWLQNYEMGIENASERSWLTHEIGQCYMELKEYNNAVKFAENSLLAAEIAGEDDKKIAAATLIGQAAIRDGEIKMSKEAFEKALAYAKKTGDDEARKTIEPVLREIDSFLLSTKQNENDVNTEKEEDDWGNNI